MHLCHQITHSIRCRTSIIILLCMKLDLRKLTLLSVVGSNEFDDITPGVPMSHVLANGVIPTSSMCKVESAYAHKKRKLYFFTEAIKLATANPHYRLKSH